jgi:hypothetical protein
MQYLITIVVSAAVVLVPGSLVLVAMYAGYRLWRSRSRNNRRKEIAQAIQEAKDADLYEISEHLTSEVLADCHDSLGENHDSKTGNRRAD